MVPWLTWFENWEGQIVVSGPRPLSRGAGFGNNLLLPCQSLVPWSPWVRFCHGSMAYLVRELGGSDSGLGAETTLQGCGFWKQFAVAMSILGAMVAMDLDSAMVPWLTCFENWEGQIVVSGPRPLSRGAGSGNSLLLPCQSLVPWSPWIRFCHGSMACVVRELGGSDSGLGAETTLQGCGFLKQFAVAMSILGATVDMD